MPSAQIASSAHASRTGSSNTVLCQPCQLYLGIESCCSPGAYISLQTAHSLGMQLACLKKASRLCCGCDVQAWAPIIGSDIFGYCASYCGFTLKTPCAWPQRPLLVLSCQPQLITHSVTATVQADIARSEICQLWDISMYSLCSSMGVRTSALSLGSG